MGNFSLKVESPTDSGFRRTSPGLLLHLARILLLWQRRQLPLFIQSRPASAPCFPPLFPLQGWGGWRWSSEDFSRQELVWAHFASQRVVIFQQPASLVVPIVGGQPGVWGLTIIYIMSQSVIPSVSLNYNVKLGQTLTLYDPPHCGSSFPINACPLIINKNIRMETLQTIRKV